MSPHRPPADAHAPVRGLTAPDRRRSDRVPTPGLACSWGDVLDLSPTGLRVRTRVKPALSVGQRAELNIPGPSGPIAVAARPVWVRPVGRGAFEIGACFEDLTDAARARILDLVRGFAGEPTSRVDRPGA